MPCGASTRKKGLPSGPMTLPSVVTPVVALRVASSTYRLRVRVRVRARARVGVRARARVGVRARVRARVGVRVRVRVRGRVVVRGQSCAWPPSP